ncbi:hypothetical protein [Ferruginibacter profundus]
MGTVAENRSPLTNLQLELLKSLKYMASEKQLQEIKSLLRYYFAQQLDTAIDKVEAEKNYSAEIYEKWLQANNNNDNSFIAA